MDKKVAYGRLLYQGHEFYALSPHPVSKDSWMSDQQHVWFATRIPETAYLTDAYPAPCHVVLPVNAYAYIRFFDPKEIKITTKLQQQEEPEIETGLDWIDVADEYIPTEQEIEEHFATIDKIQDEHDKHSDSYHEYLLEMQEAQQISIQ